MSRTGSRLSLPLRLTLFFFASAARGATPSGLALSLDPPRLELNAEAGAEKTETVVIANGSRAKVALKIYGLPFSVDEAGRVATGRAAAGPRDASGWLRINPAETVVEAGESAVVRVTLRVPREASGAYWTMVFAESLAPRPLASPASGPEPVNVGLRVGSYVYVQVGRPEAPSVDASLSVGREDGGLAAICQVVHRSGGVLRLTARWRAAGSSEEEFVLLPGGRRIVRFQPQGGLRATEHVQVEIEGSGIRLRREIMVPAGPGGR